MFNLSALVVLTLFNLIAKNAFPECPGMSRFGAIASTARAGERNA